MTAVCCNRDAEQASESNDRIAVEANFSEPKCLRGQKKKFAVGRDEEIATQTGNLHARPLVGAWLHLLEVR